MAAARLCAGRVGHARASVPWSAWARAAARTITSHCLFVSANYQSLIRTAYPKTLAPVKSAPKDVAAQTPLIGEPRCRASVSRTARGKRAGHCGIPLTVFGHCKAAKPLCERLWRWPRTPSSARAVATRPGAPIPSGCLVHVDVSRGRLRKITSLRRETEHFTQRSTGRVQTRTTRQRRLDGRAAAPGTVRSVRERWPCAAATNQRGQAAVCSASSRVAAHRMPRPPG